MVGAKKMVERNGVHISKMTGKLEGLRAISTNTATNEYCIKQNSAAKSNNICTHCYSHTMLKSYRKNMQPALQHNSDYLSSKVHDMDSLPVILDAFMRLDAHGELINLNHLTNLVNMAVKNPHCRFVLWTKRNDIVVKYFKDNDKPSNFALIYSNPIISTVMGKVPRYFDKTFNNVLEDEKVELQNCTGQKCKDCLLCYTINNTTVIVEKVKKY